MRFYPFWSREIVESATLLDFFWQLLEKTTGLPILKILD
jgi:hypothetical protein